MKFLPTIFPFLVKKPTPERVEQPDAEVGLAAVTIDEHLVRESDIGGLRLMREVIKTAELSGRIREELSGRVLLELRGKS